jgi:Mg-chelatase subunit ChlI
MIFGLGKVGETSGQLMTRKQTGGAPVCLIQSPARRIQMAYLAGVVQQLNRERDQAAKTVKQLDAALAALNGGSYGRKTGTRRKISAAGRVRIAAAPRAGWAKARGNSGPQKPKVVGMPKKKKKRTMSAAARRKIAAAQRARWAKVKAAQEKSA